MDEYLDIAKLLRPELHTIEGFIDNTRFASARTPGRLLSLSPGMTKSPSSAGAPKPPTTIRASGRFKIFADYRLRVAEVTDDTHPPTGVSLQQSRYDET